MLVQLRLLTWLQVQTPPIYTPVHTLLLIVASVSCEYQFAEWLLSVNAPGALHNVFALLTSCEGEVLRHVCHAGNEHFKQIRSLLCLTHSCAVANMCCEDGLRAIMAEQVTPLKLMRLQNSQYFAAVPRIQLYVSAAGAP
jgi:hypothetical protein